jgi:hypothetical protein
MTDESRFMALRCTATEGEHPLDEHGRITLADPDGDMWAWPSEHVAPWLSAIEVDAVERLMGAVRRLREALLSSGTFSEDFTVALRDLWEADTYVIPLRMRMGWP